MKDKSAPEIIKKPKKLTLSKETLKELTISEADLAQVAGGALPWCGGTTTGSTCHTCGCGI